MLTWCRTYSAVGFGTMLSVVKRLKRLEDEAVISETTAEPIKRVSYNKTRKDKVGPTLSITPEAISNNTNNGAPPPAKPQKIYDDMGVEIPKGCLEVWARRDEIKELAAVISEIKCKIERKRKEEDKLFMKVPQYAIDAAEKLYSYLKEARPETVCGSCKGHPEIHGGVCASCQSTGLQSMEQYNRLTAIEEKQIRAKAYGAKRLSAGMPR